MDIPTSLKEGLIENKSIRNIKFIRNFISKIIECFFSEMGMKSLNEILNKNETLENITIHSILLYKISV